MHDLLEHPGAPQRIEPSRDLPVVVLDLLEGSQVSLVVRQRRIGSNLDEIIQSPFTQAINRTLPDDLEVRPVGLCDSVIHVHAYAQPPLRLTD